MKSLLSWRAELYFGPIAKDSGDLVAREACVALSIVLKLERPPLARRQRIRDDRNAADLGRRIAPTLQRHFYREVLERLV